MSFRRNDDTPSQEPEDDGTTSAASSNDNEDEPEPSIEEQIRVFLEHILQSNNGDLRAVPWDLVAQIATPLVGFAVTGAECEERFAEIVDDIFPPDQPVPIAQTTVNAGNIQSSSPSNAAVGIANGGQAGQGSAIAAPSTQSAPSNQHAASVQHGPSVQPAPSTQPTPSTQHAASTQHGPSVQPAPSTQYAPYGSGHTPSAAILSATSSNMPNPQTNTAEEDEWETEASESA